MLSGMAISFVQIIVLYYISDVIMKAFTDQAIIKEQLAKAWPAFLLFTLFDTTQAISGGVVRACGKQGIGAFVTSVS